MKNIVTLSILILLTLGSCTDVGENVYDKYAAEDFYGSAEGSDAALASVYAQIPGNWGGVGYAGADNGWYDLNSMSADEQVIPHRNTGDWQLDFARLYQREWLPNDGINSNAWNWLYRSVFLANLAIEQLELANAEQSKIAEARVLRAFFYYLLMDDYGNIPFFTENDLPADQIQQVSRPEVFSFIESELKANLEDLPTTKGGNYYGRFNKWAGYTLLAKLYLNAEVYTGKPMWQECLDAIQVIEQGGFSLHTGANDSSLPLGSKYYELFGDVLPDDETILAIFTTVDVVGRNIFMIRSLGGTDGTLLAGAGAWNGSVVPQEYVEKFADNDIRKRQFRFGSDPSGPQPAGFIEYAIELDNLDNPGADRNAGARNTKFWTALPANGGGSSNDFPIYRYADVLLMKAECLVRIGDAASSKPFIDQVRQRAGLSGLPSAPTLEQIYDERGFELSWEAHRRQDMIRFGTFTQERYLVPAVGDHFKLFPIPTSALNTNPNLTQNPGW